MCVGYSSRPLTGKPVYALMNSSCWIQWEVFQPVTKNRKSEDTINYCEWQCPVSHAVGHLELLYNNTTKHYDSILSKNTLLLILPLIIAKWQNIKHFLTQITSYVIIVTIIYQPSFYLTSTIKMWNKLPKIALQFHNLNF